MILQIIKTEKQYEDLLEWIDLQFDLNLSPESMEGQQLQIALLLIKQYEDEYYKIPSPDPKVLHQKLGIPATVFLA